MYVFVAQLRHLRNTRKKTNTTMLVNNNSRAPVPKVVSQGDWMEINWNYEFMKNESKAFEIFVIQKWNHYTVERWLH